MPVLESPTANFSGSETALFPPAEIRALMRAELERSRRYGHPLACFVVAVDRLRELTDYYGAESREEVMEGVVEVLTSKLRVGDFLGYRDGDRFVLALPFTSAVGARALAGRLMEGSRELAFDCDGRTLHISLTIGAAYSENLDGGGFEELHHVAEKGASQGLESGGGRLFEWKEEPRTEQLDLGELRRELEERTRILKESLRVAEPAPSAIPTDLTLAQKLRELLEAAVAKGADAEDDGREEELQQQIQGLISQHNRQIDVLERRIGKLTCSLEATEGELRRMALLKDVEPGVASIFRTVQGLDGDGEGGEVKREMMSAIFEANIDLQDAITRRAQSN